MLLFRLYEKVTKKDVFTFFLLLQKEPKSSRDFVLRPRFKALHRHAFYRNCSFLCLKRLSGFEPVRKEYLSTDAESSFVRNQSRSAGLPPQAVDKKGDCTLSLLRWKRKIGVG